MTSVPCWTCNGIGSIDKPTRIVLAASAGTVPAGRRCKACGGSGRRDAKQPLDTPRPFG